MAMTYKEFNETMKVIGMTVDTTTGNQNNKIYVREPNGEIVASVSIVDQFYFNNNWIAFKDLTPNTKLAVYLNLFKLAQTPIEKRVPEVYYRVKLPSGHYLTTAYEGAPVEWTREKNRSDLLTKDQIMETDPAYWQFAYSI